MTATQARSWRLRGYAGKQLVHDQVVYSDAELDKALRALEQDPEITRTPVTPA